MNFNSISPSVSEIKALDRQTERWTEIIYIYIYGTIRVPFFLKRNPKKHDFLYCIVVWIYFEYFVARDGCKFIFFFNTADMTVDFVF